jgi:hypothetical protein
MQENIHIDKLSILDKRINAFRKGYRQNLALLGDDSQEISHILQQYYTSSPIDDIILIHATTSYCSAQDFLKTVAFSLLSSYSKKIDSLDNIIRSLDPSIGSTTTAIKKALKNPNLNFLSIVDIINTFILETNSLCLLVIEDFLELSSLFSDFYSSFSKFIILQRNCMTVITSSSPKDAKKVISGELNLLFGNFEIVPLSDSTPLINFIYFNKKIHHLNPTPFFISFFIKHAGSNSLYYDTLSTLAEDRYNQDNEINSIIQICQDSLFSPNTYFFQKFMRQIDCIRSHFKDYRNVIKLLIHMSEGYLRAKELASLGIYDSKSITQRLQKLCELNYVRNFGNIYKIKDSLFSFWLAHVFKIHSSFPAHKLQKRLFARKLADYIALSQEEFTEDPLTKMLHLFSSFKNDTVSLSKKRYQLPFVDKTKTISYPENRFHLLIGEGREIIFAGIKERGASETDIADFLEKGANIKGKGVRKVFITLDVASSNTKLVAKNSKLTIWDVNDINQLLDIYNKPNVAWDNAALEKLDF